MARQKTKYTAKELAQFEKLILEKRDNAQKELDFIRESLLRSNLSAANFEMRLKNNELQKKLFYYIGGGLKTPFFFTNNAFKNEKNKINLEYINLNNAYKKKINFTNHDIEKFIKENSDDLKEEFINFCNDIYKEKYKIKEKFFTYCNRRFFSLII